jgi:hypothetical protein
MHVIHVEQECVGDNRTGEGVHGPRVLRIREYVSKRQPDAFRGLEVFG